MATYGWKTGARAAGPAGHYGTPSSKSYAPSRLGGPAMTMKSGMSRTSVAPRNLVGQVLPRHTFKPGLILRVMHFEAAYEDRTLADQALIETDKGPVCSKFRLMIVVECHAEHFTALTLYTHDGKGLDNKHNRSEYVSVRDSRYSNARNFRKLSDHEPLVAVDMSASAKPIAPDSTALLSWSVSRSYSLPVWKLGYLDSESTERLLKMRRQVLAGAEVSYASRERRDELGRAAMKARAIRPPPASVRPCVPVDSTPEATWAAMC